MNYQASSAWIFVLLVLIVVFMALFPSRTMIGLGIIATPVLVLIQAYVILRARDPKDLPSPDERWYES